MTLKDYQILNREAWQKIAEEYTKPAEKAWESGDPHWGIWQLPESKTRYPWADAEWASKWPTEEVWCVRLSN